MRTLFQFILKVWGWKIVGSLPDEKKYIIVVAPHTSNWDFLVGIVARFSLGVKINFLAKKQMFFFPFRTLFLSWGGIPIDRSHKGNMVEYIADLFRTRDILRLAVTPEGTRSPVKRWKEGFYHIACDTGVPVVMVGFDYPSREIRIGELFRPSGDITKDLPHIMDYFRDIKGCYPKEIPEYQPKE